MRPRLITTLALTAVVAAACGGSTPTQAPVATPGGGGGPTPAGGPTDAPPVTTPPDGGGGGSGGGGTGSVKWQISGPVEDTGELPFFAFGSRFVEPDIVLNFSDPSGQIMGIGQAGGTPAISYIGPEFALSWGVCPVWNLDLQATSGSGTFECTDGVGSKLSDSSILSGATIKGSFEARS